MIMVQDLIRSPVSRFFHSSQSPVYVGGNAGYGQATASSTATLGVLSATASENLSGGIAGAQVGAQYQVGIGVFGVEADWQWSGQKIDSTVFGVTFTDSIPWFLTVRGRAGVAIDRVLVYGTGGGGYGEFKSEAAAGGLSVSTSTQRGLWTVGAGVEVAATQNVIFGVEYLYLRTADVITNVGPVTVTSHLSDNIVRGRLSVKFGPTPVVQASY
jgi:outer membrane immunogenic protein